eukprot:512450_1
MMSATQTFVAVLLILCCIVSIAVLTHTVYSWYIRKLESGTTMMKTVVLITMILLLSDTFIHTIYQLLEISSYKFSHFSCQCYVILVGIAYYTGKSFLFNFYTLRAYLTFKNSSMEYSTNTIIKALILINTLSFLNLLWILFQLPFTTEKINKNGKYYCVVTASVEDGYSYHNMLTYYIVWSTLVEIILSVCTMWLFTNKLSKMSFSMFLMRQNSYVAKKSSVNDEKPLGLESLDWTKQNEIELWHRETENINFMLMVVTKLLILFMITFVTTAISTILYLTVFSRIYAIDSTINSLCIYLSFEFSGNVWNKLCCGNKCLSFWFPLVKMWTLTPCKCSIYNNNQRHMHKMIRKEYELYYSRSNIESKQTCVCCWRILEKELEKDMDDNYYIELKA